ncbi:MAG: sortase [Anaerolineales bacterium]|nr:sortase [Anaerolineales bacterium]
MPYLDLLTRQARTLSLPIILTLLMGIFPLQPVSADPIAAPGIKNLPPPAAGQTAAPAELLQFTSGGHALGFEPEGVYLAARDHVLRENFAGTGGVMPVADQTPNADGQAQPLGTVAYPDLWPGITLIYDSPPGGILRSTYQVEPGADPNQIALRYNVPVQIDESGNLIFEFETGQMTASAPIAWQEINGQRVPVDVAFEINNYQLSIDNSQLTINFSLASYNPAYPLTIDPTLAWNTFLGSSSTDEGTAIAVDDSGNVYVAGTSYDTWGAPENAHSGGQWNDTFAAKLSGSGVLLWNTFLGPASPSYGASIAVDGGGNVYVAGTSIAAWGAPVNAYLGSRDAFAAKLNGSSGALIWNTFLGSGDTDQGTGIAVDGSGNVYVAGGSYATWGTPVNPFAGVGVGDDAFAAKLNSSGALQWHTFMGAEAVDTGEAIAVDGSGNVYVVGASAATWGTPVNAHTGGFEAFAAKLDSSGVRQWHTFMGSPGSGDWWWWDGERDWGHAIAVDGNGNVYVAGESQSTWGSPVNAFSGEDGMNTDAFAAKLNSSGVRQWNTFMGSDGFTDAGHGIAVDGGGNVYLAGESYNPSTWGNDAFVAKLEGSGVLTWNTFLGGPGIDAGYGIAMDGGGNIYVTGKSEATWGTPVNAHAGGRDAFAAKIMLSPDLDAVKQNAGLGAGNAALGVPFDWEIDVTNSGDTNANFADTNVILKDDLPATGAAYGAPTVTGLAGVDCAIAGTTLTCTANGAVVIAPGQGFKVSFEVTPDAAGGLTNPDQAGAIGCKVDPDNHVAEDDETNNDCTDTVTVDEAVGGDVGGGDGEGDKRTFNIGAAGGTYKFGPVTVIIPPGAVDADCQLVVKESASGNFKLGDQVYDIKLLCNGKIVTQFKKASQVCIKPKDGITAGKQIFRQATGTVGFDPLPNSSGPEGTVCGNTPGTSLFALGELQLPATGFAPGAVTDLSVVGEQPADAGAEYFDLAGANVGRTYREVHPTFALEIPSLGLEMPIVGVPLTGQGWDVSWLGDSAGYLEGTAYPTWTGNTAVTAHVWDADNNPGPFVDLHTLQHGDQIVIHAWGQVYTYEVRTVEQVGADDFSFLPHEDYDVLTLITCKDYDEASGEYDWRLAVRAVLISLGSEQ